MNVLESLLPRPNFEAIMNDENEKNKLLSESILQLNPVSRMVGIMVDLMVQNQAKLTIAPKERLELAANAQKDADKCVGLAYAISCIEGDLKLKKTPQERNIFKAALLSQLETKSFETPECVKNFLKQREKNIPTTQ